MANKAITAIIIMLIICFSLIISTPMVIISTILSPYGRIVEKIPFSYKPTSPSIMDELNINVDLGDIEIKYITEPVDYCTKIDVKIEMVGPGLAEKSYYDYFNIVWENTSGRVNFTISLKAGINQAEVLSVVKNINITVALKANVICDINVFTFIQGSVDISVPWSFSVGKILVNVSKGNINYYFSDCIIEGTIIGIVQEVGNIELKMNDVEYEKNGLWTFSADIGNIVIEINQDKTTIANISGTIGTNIGNYGLAYLDNNVDVGAHFILWVNPDDITFHQRITEIVGFEEPNLDVVDGIDVYTIISNDYPALYNYNLSFSLPNGYYNIDLQNS
ncbi:MAG: hypothetical protein ACFFEY_10205 [Candidatus Thorarchaeota archaeon]